MDEKKAPPRKLSMTSTKQEMMDAYQQVLKLLEEKREAELSAGRVAACGERLPPPSQPTDQTT